MSELASTNSSSPGTTPVNHRKERGAIAAQHMGLESIAGEAVEMLMFANLCLNWFFSSFAQACETCRSRKQRCDEQRPKCGTCQKFKLECRYREPQPTKKDKTLVEILDRLKSLEGKIDTLNIRNAAPSTSAVYPPVPTTVDPIGGLGGQTGRQDSMAPSLHLSDPSSPSHLVNTPYMYVSATHKFLSWPMMQQSLESIRQQDPLLNPATIEHEGPSILLGIQSAQAGTYVDPTGEARRPVPPRLPGPSGTLPLDLSTPSLSWETMQRLSKQYFDTFNFLYPLLDRQTFLSQTLPGVVSHSFSENITSTLAYLVFALGEVAMSCAHSETAARGHNGRPSGIRGGTSDRPPGLAFFNEARKRMGFNLTECSLENVQVFALAGTTLGFSMKRAFATLNPSELTSPRADLVRRAFWHCSIIETYLHMELDLPLTGLSKLEDMVGLPSFSMGSFSEEDYIGNQASHYQEHFVSQIVLRKLSLEFNKTLGSAFGSQTVQFTRMTHSEHPPLPSTIKQLASQLDQWRGLLPEYLRWEDSTGTQTNGIGTGDMAAMPIPQVVFNSTTGEIFQSPQQPAFMFTSDLDAPPQNAYPYAIDIQVALLRSRYYWARYLIYRPFVYKALHHPEQMTREDAAGAAECLRSALKWPVTMVPTSRNKRLIPYPFFWTQNLLGILVLLHLTQQHNLLSQVRANLLGDAFDVDANETVALYLDWLRDLKTADPAANWCWGIAKALYRVDE
ncbi:hypothetical protein MKZ38_004873 [Zalerion maritima]|uniref:Zn(2)-C6 fungal-type domain-containing protein n=1 Tax=Zalerion maritima TaxID=339359 RepID=A0AAD5RLU7_9PEZI|nr:hypothetical protein MKZ38_004873 [Zalerion maritima]